ncbi:hypothetical protein ZYGR_0U03190 [Zygosaccharomyces rouxii]|uniref:Uncharacterized protein n=1 Tax=Zygosaccharomyces rouxii TaxID=4956 RepID=A0A1Q3A4A4_ZYGRO|nr:hypothetical protein ZYGR_0U03190 [Zygosaccharomyces rouxii]
MPAKSLSGITDLSNSTSECSRSSTKLSQPRLLSPLGNTDTTRQSIPGSNSTYNATGLTPSPTSQISSLEQKSQEQNPENEDSFISGSDSNLDLAIAQARDESNSPSVQPPSHKKLTLSMPFKRKVSQGSSPTSLGPSLLPRQSKDDIQRETIKNKLKKTSSISTIEEQILFQDEKGSVDVRKRALKKTFELESLKHALNTIKALRHKRTDDGYDYKRVHSIWDELEGDVLIMGGYRGSILRDTKTNRRVWIPLKAGLNLRKVDLRIGPNDEDEVEAMKHIYPDGILSHVGPVDVCKRLIKRLKSNSKVRLTNFGYDWRLSLDISSEQLSNKLQQIYDSQEVKRGTYIIAHSMGGLVAHKALQDKTHLIRGIIYVGSPSRCPNIVGPFKYGDEVLMNKTILSKETNFLMRSSFAFLPENGRCFLQRGTGKKFNLDFFDPQVWVKLGLSPLVDEDRVLDPHTVPKVAKKQSPEDEKRMAKTETKTKLPQPGISTEGNDILGILNPIPLMRSISGPSDKDLRHQPPQNGRSSLRHWNPFSLFTKISSSSTDAAQLTEHKRVQDDQNDMLFKTSHEECVRYLERTLKRTKEFLSSLEYRPGKEYPPLVMLYSNQVPTVRGVHIQGLKDVKLGRYDDFSYGPGDGVIYHKWLLPEQRGFPVVAKINSDCGHVSLMSDLDAMAKAFISLVDNDKTIQTD